MKIFNLYEVSEYADKHVEECLPYIQSLFHFIWDNQAETKKSYGDVDYSIQKIKYKDKKVLYLVNNVTCADINKFIFIYDNESYHIRQIFNKSDYRKGARWVNRPNLKWYKDREFSLDFKQELHQTPLGSTYGDRRDKGYLLSFTYWGLRSMEYKSEGVSLSTVYSLDIFLDTLGYAKEEIEEGCSG